MLRIKTSFLAILAALSVLSAHAQTLDEIIDKNIAAIGGKEKLLSLNSLVSEGTLTINGNPIPVKITQVHNKGIRVDITFNGMENYTIQTKDSGWNYFPIQGQKKAEATPPEVIKETADELDLQSILLNYKEKGHTVELEGKDDVDGTECFKIKVVTKSGMQQTFFIDPSNYYIIKVVTKTKANGQEQEQTQSFSNYQKMDNGYVFAFSMTGFGPGELKLTKIDVNPTVDPAIFKPTNP